MKKISISIILFLLMLMPMNAVNAEKGIVPAKTTMTYIDEKTDKSVNVTRYIYYFSGKYYYSYMADNGKDVYYNISANGDFVNTEAPYYEVEDAHNFKYITFGPNWKVYFSDKAGNYMLQESTVKSENYTSNYCNYEKSANGKTEKLKMEITPSGKYNFTYNDVLENTSIVEFQPIVPDWFAKKLNKKSAFNIPSAYKFLTSSGCPTYVLYNPQGGGQEGGYLTENKSKPVWAWNDNGYIIFEKKDVTSSPEKKQIDDQVKVVNKNKLSYLICLKDAVDTNKFCKSELSEYNFTQNPAGSQLGSAEISKREKKLIDCLVKNKTDENVCKSEDTTYNDSLKQLQEYSTKSGFSTGLEGLFDNDINIDSSQSFCDSIGKLNVEFKTLFDTVKLLLIGALIALTILDFIKALTSGNDDGVKKAWKNFMIRVGIIVAIFLLPMLIKIILGIFFGSTFNACLDIF